MDLSNLNTGSFKNNNVQKNKTGHLETTSIAGLVRTLRSVSLKPKLEITKNKEYMEDSSGNKIYY